MQLILLPSQSDDEPEFIDEAPVPSTKLQSSHANIKVPQAIAAHSPTQITPDDEPEFVEGLSSTLRKSRKSNHYIIEVDGKGHEIIDLTDL